MKISKLRWLNDIYNGINFKNLPHGIIISGPSGIGKKILANKISKDLLINKNNNTGENTPRMIVIATTHRASGRLLNSSRLHRGDEFENE